MPRTRRRKSWFEPSRDWRSSISAARLKTWVYRIAVNYVLDVKKSPVEHLHLNFQRFGDDLAEGLSADGPADAERSLLIEEVKIGCTLGMLQCLDRPHRLAYVLGEILDLPGPECADALGIAPAAVPQAPAARAHGDRSVYSDLLWAGLGQRRLRLPPTCARSPSPRPRPREALEFAEQPSSYQETREFVRRAEQARWALQVHRTSHPRASTVDFARRIAQSFDSRHDR